MEPRQGDGEAIINVDANDESEPVPVSTTGQTAGGRPGDRITRHLDPFVTEVLRQYDGAQTNPAPTNDERRQNMAAPMEAGRSHTPHTSHAGAGVASWNGPKMYFTSLISEKSDTYYDIVDFVKRSARSKQDVVVSDAADGGQLIFKSGPTKPKLETLSVAQWSVANLAILGKLLEDGSLRHLPLPSTCHTLRECTSCC